MVLSVKSFWPSERSRGGHAELSLWCILRSNISAFVYSLLIGMFFALLLRKYEEVIQLNYTIARYMPAPNNYERMYTDWLRQHNIGSFKSDELGEAWRKLREDRFLFDITPVLCVVFTTELKRAKAIRHTWGQHCNAIAFYGTFTDEVVPVSQVPNTNSWSFLCGGLIRAWKTHHGTFKWMLVVDDLTYAIPENLRYLVAHLNTNDHHYLGHPVKHNDNSQVYNLAKSGFAINSKLLELFVKDVPDDDTCDQFTNMCSSPDCILGRLFQHYKAFPVDTRDNRGRGRFNAFNIHDLIIPKTISVFNPYWSSSVYLSSEGADCCSDQAIAFHDISPTMMEVMEYSVYHLRPHYFGVADFANSTFISTQISDLLTKKRYAKKFKKKKASHPAAESGVLGDTASPMLDQETEMISSVNKTMEITLHTQRTVFGKSSGLIVPTRRNEENEV